MFGRAIWDKLPECIFGNFGGSKFLKIKGVDLSPKSPEPNQKTLCIETNIFSQPAITK